MSNHLPLRRLVELVILGPALVVFPVAPQDTFLQLRRMLCRVLVTVPIGRQDVAANVTAGPVNSRGSRYHGFFGLLVGQICLTNVKSLSLGGRLKIEPTKIVSLPRIGGKRKPPHFLQRLIPLIAFVAGCCGKKLNQRTYPPWLSSEYLSLIFHIHDELLLSFAT